MWHLIDYYWHLIVCARFHNLYLSIKAHWNKWQQVQASPFLALKLRGAERWPSVLVLLLNILDNDSCNCTCAESEESFVSFRCCVQCTAGQDSFIRSWLWQLILRRLLLGVWASRNNKRLPNTQTRTVPTDAQPFIIKIRNNAPVSSRTFFSFWCIQRVTLEKLKLKNTVEKKMAIVSLQSTSWGQIYECPVYSLKDLWTRGSTPGLLRPFVCCPSYLISSRNDHVLQEWMYLWARDILPVSRFCTSLLAWQHSISVPSQFWEAWKVRRMWLQTAQFLGIDAHFPGAGRTQNWGQTGSRHLLMLHAAVRQVEGICEQSSVASPIWLPSVLQKHV